VSLARHPSPRPLPEARRLLLDAAPPLADAEDVAAEDALGRITAAAVYARASVPHYHGAAMDGIALRAADTPDASPERPVALTLGTPATAARPFSWVDTGNALPAWADAVVMVERVLDASSGAPVEGRAARTVRVHAPAARLQHVRLVGEDVVASEPLLPRGQRVRAWDVGALLAAGVERVAVRRRPVVALLPTGDELIEPGDARRAGRIVEFNSRMIAALVREWGGEPRRTAPVGDNLEALCARIAGALAEADVVCVLAGSSGGEHDFTAAALAAFGEVLVRGVELMPGKPAIVAAIADPSARARVALGIPGYPVSAAVVCRELLEPLVAHLLGVASAERATLRAVVPYDLRSRPRHEEMVRVSLGEVAGRTVAIPLGRGAGAITSLVRADGIVRVPPGVELVAAGAEVEVELLRPPDEVRGTVLVAGSPDAALALLEDVLRAAGSRSKLAPRALDARAALVALARGEAHVAVVAGAAVDEGAQVVVLHLASRVHGLVVAPGNPLAIRADLERSDVRTLPHVLPHGPHGGGEATPMAAAAAVQSGLADAAPGYAWAAHALGLGFVPLGTEDVELVLRADFAASEAGVALAGAVRDRRFRDALAARAGYDASRTGERRR
jgi:putative molybdopterin biosynthesis protein